MLEMIPIWLVLLSLSLFGVIVGSFAGAQVWRIRAYQLRDDDDRLAGLNKRRKLSDDDRADKAELKASAAARKAERKRLDGLIGRVSRDYSRCLHCQHRLAWYDLLPLVSWLSTRGRCRYCQETIGHFEPLMELGMASFFVLSFALWPTAISSGVEVTQFVVWLLSGVALSILFAYDAKWFLLPDVVMVPFIILAALYAGLELYQVGVSIESLGSILGALAVLSGLYWLLHVVSRGTWVGYGDVTLGAGLALLLGRFDLAIVALFLANLIGTVLVLPQLWANKLDRKTPIPFGPLLIIGTLLAYFFGQAIIDWYTSFL